LLSFKNLPPRWSGRSEGLLPHSPLRTQRARFPRTRLKQIRMLFSEHRHQNEYCKYALDDDKKDEA